jgi:hypothetical protein
MIVEWAAFRIAKGVSEEQVVKAARDIQEEFLAKQRGFIRRELLRGEGGQWADLIYWKDRASVDAAMKEAESSPVCHLYFKVMEPVSASGVLLFERSATYE